MTNVREGDTVRIVLEGKARDVLPGAGATGFSGPSLAIGQGGDGSNTIWTTAKHVKSVEILDRKFRVGDTVSGHAAHEALPVGAVVRDGQVAGVKTKDGHWTFSDYPDSKAHPAIDTTLVYLPA